MKYGDHYIFTLTPPQDNRPSMKRTGQWGSCLTNYQNTIALNHVFILASSQFAQIGVVNMALVKEK